MRKLTRNVTSAPVEMRAFLAQTTIKVSDLMNLQPGDILTTSKPSGSEVVMQVEGKHKFWGRIGQFRGVRAIQVTRAAPLGDIEKSGEKS